MLLNGTIKTSNQILYWILWCVEQSRSCIVYHCVMLPKKFYVWIYYFCFLLISELQGNIINSCCCSTPLEPSGLCSNSAWWHEFLPLPNAYLFALVLPMPQNDYRKNLISYKAFSSMQLSRQQHRSLWEYL